MLLSKSMLWLFNQSLHLEKIKKKYNKKESTVNLKPEWAIVTVFRFQAPDQFLHSSLRGMFEKRASLWAESPQFISLGQD